MEEKYHDFTVNGRDYRIYKMEYLDALNFTDDEIEEFIEKDTLYNSYCVGVMCELNLGLSTEQALEVMTSDSRWYNRYHWTPAERVFYEKRFVPIIMKVIDYGVDEAWQEVHLWSGFGSAPSMYKSDSKEENEAMYAEYNRLSNEAYEELNKKIYAD